MNRGPAATAHKRNRSGVPGAVKSWQPALCLDKMPNKVNQAQFMQILKRRNYKRSLIKPIDVLVAKVVFPIHAHTL